MLRPTLSTLLMLSCGALLFLFCESTRQATNDLAIYLAQGREMAELGGYADVDAFTHTVTGRSFLNGSWGAQRLFYALWRTGGYALLQLTVAVCVSSTVFVAAWGARRAGRGSAGTAFGALLAAWLVVQNLGLRPQTFALPLFAVYAAVAMTMTPTLLTGVLSAAIVAVWANLHGSFAVAPVLSLLVAAGLAWEIAVSPESGAPAGPAGFVRTAARALVSGEPRAHLLTAGAAVLGSAANPYGLGLWLYVAENTSSPASRGLAEWGRTSITDPAGIRLLGAAVLIGLVIAFKRRVPARRDVPAMLAFTGLALTAMRHVVWTGMVYPIVFARLLLPERRAPAPAAPADPGAPSASRGSAAPVGERRLHPVFALGMAAFWGALLVSESPWVKVRSTGDAEIAARFNDATPVRLTAWAAENGVSGNLFNSMEWGGWLVWRLPDVRVFADVRIWIFPDDVWAEYLSISDAAPGWDDRLAARNVEWAVLEKRFHGDTLVPAMRSSPHWELRYEDDLGAVFHRR